MIEELAKIACAVSMQNNEAWEWIPEASRKRYRDIATAIVERMQRDGKA